MKKALLILSCAALLTSCSKAKAPDVETAKEDVPTTKIEKTENLRVATGKVISFKDGKLELELEDKDNLILNASSDFNAKEDEVIGVVYDENKNLKSINRVNEEPNVTETPSEPSNNYEIDLEKFNEYDSYDFDNFEVVLYTDAEIDDTGEVMWDDGQNYEVVVYDNDANSFSLYSGFLQHGEISIVEDSKNPDAFTLQVKTQDTSEKTKYIYKDGEIKEVK